MRGPRGRSGHTEGEELTAGAVEVLKAESSSVVPMPGPLIAPRACHAARIAPSIAHVLTRSDPSGGTISIRHFHQDSRK
jgi:hypothetical protein